MGRLVLTKSKGIIVNKYGYVKMYDGIEPSKNSANESAVVQCLMKLETPLKLVRMLF